MSLFTWQAVLPAEENDTGQTENPAAAHARARRFGRIARSTRVMLLAFALVVMSLVDLSITLTYLQGTGLAEENPFARIVMSHGSAELLAGWKVMTILPTVIVLLMYRKKFSAELLGWIACGILLLVSVRWIQYADATEVIAESMPALEGGIDHRWVTLD